LHLIMYTQTVEQTDCKVIIYVLYTCIAHLVA
jgi:hypothetical protein